MIMESVEKMRFADPQMQNPHMVARADRFWAYIVAGLIGVDIRVSHHLIGLNAWWEGYYKGFDTGEIRVISLA